MIRISHEEDAIKRMLLTAHAVPLQQVLTRAGFACDLVFVSFVGPCRTTQAIQQLYYLEHHASSTNMDRHIINLCLDKLSELE
jgi:hypothetical protein